MAKAKKKKTQCDYGDHKLFDTLGGDKLCALGCGYREKGAGDIGSPTVMRTIFPGTKDEWKDEFASTVRACAKTRNPFTSAHIATIVGVPDDDVTDSISVIMGKASRDGIIKGTGRRVQSKYDGELTEWIGV